MISPYRTDIIISDDFITLISTHNFYQNALPMKTRYTGYKTHFVDLMSVEYIPIDFNGNLIKILSE